MTNEEAVTVLNMVECHGSLVIQAKEMAIEALVKSDNKGEWVVDNNGILTCDKCGTHILFKTNFCPTCGADMRGDNYNG